MTTRSRQETVTFSQSFTLAEVEGVQPAGSYIVQTDDETIEGLSFLAYRRTDTRIQIPLQAGFRGSVQSISVDPRALEATLARDRALSQID